MKILFLSNRGLLPIKDGHTRRSFNILKGLAKYSDVYFLSLYERPEEISPGNIDQLKEFCRNVEFYPAPKKTVGIQMISRILRSLVSLEPYTIWRHYSRQYDARVHTLMSTGQFDVVHCDILPICYAVRGRKGGLRTLTDHDVSYLKCLRMGKEARNLLLKMFLYLEAWKLKRYESKVLTEVDLGIAVSELDRDVLKRICPDGRFIVVPNGVEVERFTPNLNAIKGNRLVWLGGFDHYPNREGVYFLLEKFYPRIKATIPDVQLHIVGGGVTKKLEQLARKDPSVALIGYVEDPLPHLQKASVFVAPILSGGGTRLKILEAMASGSAVVTTTIGCEGIDGIDGVHYMVADRPDQFAASVARLLGDDSFRLSMELNARKLVEAKYGYEDIVSRLSALYKERVDARRI